MNNPNQTALPLLPLTYGEEIQRPKHGYTTIPQRAKLALEAIGLDKVRQICADAKAKDLGKNTPIDVSCFVMINKIK